MPVPQREIRNPGPKPLTREGARIARFNEPRSSVPPIAARVGGDGGLCPNPSPAACGEGGRGSGFLVEQGVTRGRQQFEDGCADDLPLLAVGIVIFALATPSKTRVHVP